MVSTPEAESLHQLERFAECFVFLLLTYVPFQWVAFRLQTETIWKRAALLPIPFMLLVLLAGSQPNSEVNARAYDWLVAYVYSPLIAFLGTLILFTCIKTWIKRGVRDVDR